MMKMNMILYDTRKTRVVVFHSNMAGRPLLMSIGYIYVPLIDITLNICAYRDRRTGHLVILAMLSAPHR